MDQIPKAKKDIEQYGRVYKTNSGYSAKSGYLQVYETLLKTYDAISSKLGLSPKDQEKWRVDIEREFPERIY